MTPEQEQLQAQLKKLRDLENYNAARDSILAHLAAAEVAVVENRVDGGDWSTPEMKQNHATMKLAMARPLPPHNAPTPAQPTPA